MNIIDAIVAITGILGFIGTLVSWKTDNETAFNVTLVLTVISVIILIGRYLYIKIYSRSKKLTPVRYLNEPLWISSDRRNRQSIDSSFLNWDECTILLWLYVPQPGDGLRYAPHNKYIIAHQTEDGENSSHINAFFLRYSSNNTWDFIISNPQGEIPRDIDRFRFEDGLEAGWHRMQVSWNHTNLLLTFSVDGGERITERYQHYLNYWPRKLADRVYIGAWVNPYPESYCDTKIAHLWIYNRFLEPSDVLVQEHRSMLNV